MGKRQKKKSGLVQLLQKAVASLATTVPVPFSLGGTSADVSGCGSPLLKFESTSCPDIGSGVNLDKLRQRQFALEPLPECLICTSLSRLKDKTGRAQVAVKKASWICLACGQIGCGAHMTEAEDGDYIVDPLIDHSHAKMHSKAWMHPIVMQCGESLDCWCIECKTQLKFAAVPAGDSRVRMVDESAKVAI